MSKSSVVNLINSFLENRFGLRIQPSADSRLSKCRSHFFKELGVDCVFDVGANVGQYALRIREMGFNGKIVSFEPSPAFQELSALAMHDRHWNTVDVALSHSRGRQPMYLSSNSFLSSSLLRPTGILNEFDIHFNKDAFVEVHTLDEFLPELSLRNYLKLDVQGNEMSIIRGGKEALKQFQAVEFESAFRPQYESESNFLEIANELSNMGFRPVMIAPTHWSTTGSLISLDSIFVRSQQ